MDVEGWACLIAQFQPYSKSISAGDGWGPYVSATFGWQGQGPSPGAVLQWDSGGDGWTYTQGWASASINASASSSGSCCSGARGEPGDNDGNPAGCCCAFASQDTAGNYFAFADAAGYPGGVYDVPGYSSGPGGYNASASWSLSASGVYLASPGTTTIVVWGGGGASGYADGSISIPEGGGAQMAAYAHAKGNGGYYVEVSTP